MANVASNLKYINLLQSCAQHKTTPFTQTPSMFHMRSCSPRLRKPSLRSLWRSGGLRSQDGLDPAWCAALTKFAASTVCEILSASPLRLSSGSRLRGARGKSWRAGMLLSRARHAATASGGSSAPTRRTMLRPGSTSVCSCWPEACARVHSVMLTVTR